jgi:WD40 repeat protein
VQGVAFSSDDRHIVSGSYDKSVQVWDASMGKMLKVLEGHTGSVTSIAFSSDDRRIVSGSHDKSVQVWDASTGEMLKVPEGHIDYVTSVVFSSDDRRIVSGSDNNSVWVWDVSTGGVIPGSNDKSVHLSVVPTTQQKSLKYVRQKTEDLSGYQRHTGWLLSSEGEHYLMFVPLSASLPDSSNILTLPRSYAASVDFTSSTLGPEWCNCFFS